ncbi:MAG: alpha/beta fold hydrolase [Chloroflexota bacterium]|nr:alpha/beta fold hydrolase [Chloroflexota bacterium]
MSFTSHFIEANGIQQHYYRSGGDKPPLLMLHGFTDDGACWFPTAESFTDAYDVILPDARGHGQSARIAGIGFSWEGASGGGVPVATVTARLVIAQRVKNVVVVLPPL